MRLIDPSAHEWPCPQIDTDESPFEYSSRALWKCGTVDGFPQPPLPLIVGWNSKTSASEQLFPAYIWMLALPACAVGREERRRRALPALVRVDLERASMVEVVVVVVVVVAVEWVFYIEQSFFLLFPGDCAVSVGLMVHSVRLESRAEHRRDPRYIYTLFSRAVEVTSPPGRAREGCTRYQQSPIWRPLARIRISS
jgi:hypothetical protein